MDVHGWPSWSRSTWWGENLETLAAAFRPTKAATPSKSSANGFLTRPEISVSSSNASGGDDAQSETVRNGHVTPNGEDQPVNRFGRPIRTPENSLSGPNLPGEWTASTHQLVYLSADADEELQTLSESEIYIIGGIVDRNRHKVGITLSTKFPACRFTRGCYADLISSVHMSE